MAASILISVEEYLGTVYRPDCDYNDGTIEERNLGELDHGWVQSHIATAINSRSKLTGLYAITEWRFQLTPTKFRVPDVVITQGKPREKILSRAPLVCIEILSPDDRASRVNARIGEYLDFGVPAVWLIDPEARSLTIYRKNLIERVTSATVRVESTDFEIPLEEIFE